MREIFQVGDLEIDLAAYEVRRNGSTIKLEKMPMEILVMLVENRGRLVTREQIAERIWGKGVFVDREHGINTAIRKLRHALQDNPDDPQFIETVVGKGYRFIGRTQVVSGTEAAAETRPVESRHFRKRSVTIAVAVAVILIGFGFAWWRIRSVPGVPPVRSIAVIPLKNLSGNPADEYLADGMTDELITSLAKVSALRVASYTSTSKYKATSKALPEIGRELHVDAVVEGSIVRSGDQIRITAQLIYAPADQHLWAEEYQRSMRDVLYLEQEVARDIAEQIRVKLTPKDQSRLQTVGAVDPAAYDSYLRGRSFWNQRNEASLYKAIEQFKKSIDIDPGYAPAYSGLADCYTTLAYLSYVDPLEAFPRARDAAEHALQLDKNLAEAHTSLAYYNLYHGWNWTDAEKEFVSAIELNPNYATAHQWYSYYLVAMGRTDQAWAEITRAQALDALSVSISTDIGFNYFYGRDYDHAIAQLRQTLTVSPEFPLAHLWLGRAYQQKKMYAEAIREFERTDKALPGWVVTIAGIGNAYGEWGERDKAQQVLIKLQEMSGRKCVTPYGVALVYAGMDDKENAFAWLEKAYAGRSHWLVWLNRDPRWDRLRSDKRFSDLTRRVGLPR